MLDEQLLKLTRDDHWFRFWMPYCLTPLKRPRQYLPLNRNYKPLGVLSKDWVDYEPFADTHGVVFSRDPATFRDVWVDDPTQGLFLYDDGPLSRRDYFERLGRLMVHAARVSSAVDA